MDIKEKQILVSLIASVLIFVMYTLHVYAKFVSGNFEIINDFHFWGKSFLVLIPIAIATQILINILFAIYTRVTTGHDIDTKEDERDKLIELKAIKISHYLFILGFALAMGSLTLRMEPWVMFVLLISSGFISSIIGEIARLYFYKKGV